MDSEAGFLFLGKKCHVMTSKKNLGKRVKNSYSIKRYNNFSKSFFIFKQFDMKEEVNLRIEYDLLLNKKGQKSKSRHVQYSLRNKSWKPECVRSFNMEKSRYSH
jgi:hypothetical protein